MEIPHSESLEFNEFTLTFWIFLVKGFGDLPGYTTGLKWCPLIQKGVDDELGFAR